jgi:nitroreductase
MVNNRVLEAIRERRSVSRFRPDAVPDDQLEAVLEAGRWAPSFANSQPWTFIVVRDAQAKAALANAADRITIARKGLAEAPVVIAIVVDPTRDPEHFVEAGACAAQNMALAAHSLGLATFWVGAFDPSSAKDSAEELLKDVLGVPRQHRLIALLPLGVAAVQPQKERREPGDVVRNKTF